MEKFGEFKPQLKVSSPVGPGQESHLRVMKLIEGIIMDVMEITRILTPRGMVKVPSTSNNAIFPGILQLLKFGR